MAQHIRRFGPLALVIALLGGLVGAIAPHIRLAAASPAPATPLPIVEASAPTSEDVCPAEMEAEGIFPCAGPCYCDPPSREPTDPSPPPPPPTTGTPTTPPGGVTTPSGGHGGPVITPRWNTASGSVNAYTGEFHWALPLPTYHVPGPRFGTGFWLVYRSQAYIDGVTGNWDVTFNQRLVELVPSGDIACFTGTARTGDVFTKSGTVWYAPDGWPCELIKLAGFGSTGNSFRMVDASGTYREYDPDGFLVLMGDPSGNTLQFTRSSSAPNEVTSITDDTGRSSTLAYTNGRLTSFTDPTGAVTTLSYHSTTGWLASVTTPSVTFKDSTGATATRGIVTSFVYSSGFGTAYRNGNLLEILDDSGVAQIENTYDSSDRIQTQENALGGVWQFSYWGTTTDVFHPSGYKKRLTFDADGRTVQSEEYTASGMGGTALRTGEPSSYVTTIVRHTGCSCGAPQTITLPDGTVWAYTRNALGQPTQLTVTPGSGVAGGSRTWSWTYGAPYSPTFARLLTETDPLGETRTLAYDSLGRLTSSTEPTVTLGVTSSQVAQTTYVRTSQGLISQITRPSGLVVTFSYQSSTGYLLSMTEDPSGLAVTRSWTVDSAGRRLTNSDPMGAVRTRTFNALGRITQETEPTGGSGTTLLYDFRGSLVRLDRENRDASGTLDSSNPAWTTTWTYDAGALEATRSDEVTAGVFVTTTSEWTTWGEIARVLSPEGRETVTTYDERSLVHQVTQAPGTGIAGTQTRDYDLAGQLARLTDPLSRAWTYVTDAYGTIVRSTDPLGIKAEGVFDAAGRLTEAMVKDASSVTVARTIYSRDERGRVYQESQILLNSSGAPTGTTSDVVTLWSVGDEVLERTDPTGRKNTATYDALSRLDVATSPGGDTVDVTHDQASRVTLLRHTDLVPGGSALVWQERHTFDALGRRTAYARENASNTVLETRAWDHDGLGAVVETTDGVGNRIAFSYDGLGRNTSATRELRSGGTGAGSLLGTVTTSTSYDGDGIVLTQTDDNSRVTTYTHDARGRRTGTTLSDSSAWIYTFDLASQMTGWTDPNGTVVTQTRDNAGRVTARSITPATGVLGPTSETYSWDALGRLVGATDSDSTVSRAFDSLGRALSETAGGASPPVSPTTQFTQDLAGRLTGLVYPDATTISRTYDSDGRLNLVQASGSTLVDLDWSGSRIFRRTLGGGTVRGVSTFDAIGRLTRLAWTQQPSATAIRTLDYLWDAAGRLRYEARADLAGQGDVYAYDSLARVVDTRFQVPNPPAEVATPGSQTWTSRHAYALDGVQNRASDTKTQWGLTPVVTSYTSDTRNRYTAVGASSRAYSAKGELLSDGARTYAYDYRSRLVEVRIAGPGTLVATYGWDPLDRRDRRTVVGGVDERCYFAGDDLIALHELSGGGFRRMNLVHGGGGAAPAVAWIRDEGDANGNGNSTETIQVLCGQNYAASLVFATDASGAELEGYTYDDFGLVSTWSPGGTIRANPLLALPSRFHGLTLDAEIQLYQAGTRAYEPGVARWLQDDPLGTWHDVYQFGAAQGALSHAATCFRDSRGTDAERIEDSGTAPGIASSDGGGGPGLGEVWTDDNPMLHTWDGVNRGVTQKEVDKILAQIKRIQAMKCVTLIVRRKINMASFIASFATCDETIISAHGGNSDSPAPYLGLMGQERAGSPPPAAGAKTKRVAVAACNMTKGDKPAGQALLAWLNSNNQGIRLFIPVDEAYRVARVAGSPDLQGLLSQKDAARFAATQLGLIQDTVGKDGACCSTKTVCLFFGTRWRVTPR